MISSQHSICLLWIESMNCVCITTKEWKSEWVEMKLWKLTGKKVGRCVKPSSQNDRQTVGLNCRLRHSDEHPEQTAEPSEQADCQFEILSEMRGWAVQSDEPLGRTAELNCQLSVRQSVEWSSRAGHQTG